MLIVDLFVEMDRAVQDDVLIERRGRRDKEFHFQDWVEDRIAALGRAFSPGGRNSYPDFTFDREPLGIEVKGLATPGRHADYDANSQVPTGLHERREIYYVFGRYPKDPPGDAYPVVDLVVCHGDLLNADHEYAHLNLSARGFGSFGDINVRDRKMYVPKTPFAIEPALVGQRTLVMPSGVAPDPRLVDVGTIVRTEVEAQMTGYEFDLRRNALTVNRGRNPSAGVQHRFTLHRVAEPPARDAR